MFYDLNLPYPTTANPTEISRTLAFAAELGYNCVALSRSLSGRVATNISDQGISLPVDHVTVPKSVTLITRITFTISDPSQNHRLASLQSIYNIVALRPTNEKALTICCQSLDCDLISLDLSVRLPFIFRFNTMAAALKRGIRFEICYSGGALHGSAEPRRNLISGATALIRATRGRGIVISSEARSALGLRGPWDVINLAAVWGLSQDRGKEALCEEARKVVQLARLKRTSYRGVVDVIYGGTPEQKSAQKDKPGISNRLKRKAPPSLGDANAAVGAKDDQKSLSKTQLKKRAKRVRLEEAAQTQAAQPLNADIPHETQRSTKD